MGDFMEEVWPSEPAAKLRRALERLSPGDCHFDECMSALEEIERLRAIVDRIPPDRLNPWHTVTVGPNGWHMAHPIDCVLADCPFDGLAQAEWVKPPTAEGVWQWHDFDDEPWEWTEALTDQEEK